MLLKHIEALCKSSKIINILETDTGQQWISDGYACYPLLKMPKVNEKTVMTILNIPEEKANKFTCTVKLMNEEYDIEDYGTEEKEITKTWAHLKNMQALKTSEGITFIHERYLKPLQDTDYLEFFERKTEAGQIYIVAKDGLFINGLIMPSTMVNEGFVRNMREFAEQCEIAYLLKEEKKNEQKDNSNDQED